MGWWEIFKVSLHSWQGGLTPLYRCPYFAYPSFFKFCPTSPKTLTPTSLSPPILTPTVLSVAQFLWLNGWSCHIWCAILLNDNMDLYMSSLGTLIRHQVYWGPTHNVVFYWYSDLISHTQTHTTYLGASRLTHPYKYIFTPHVYSWYLYYIKWLNE